MNRRPTGAIVAGGYVALLGGCASGAQISDDPGSSDGVQSAQADVSGARGDDAYIDFANASGTVFGRPRQWSGSTTRRSDWAATPSTAVVQDGEVVLLRSDGNTITVLAPRPGE